MKPYNDSLDVLRKEDNYFSEQFNELDKETKKNNE